MPRVRPTPLEEKARKTRSVIAKYQALENKTDEEIAIKMRTTTQTYRNKIKRPETFLLGELWAICDYLHISDADQAIIMGAKNIKQVIWEEKKTEREN